MNSQTAKLIRKWCKYREFEYKSVKHFFENLKPEEQMEMVIEMSEYNNAVDTGVIKAGRPKTDKTDENSDSEAKN